MASEEDATSDSADSSAVDIPRHLFGYVKSNIVDYINKEEISSAKVHHFEGQPAKIAVSFEGPPYQQPQGPPSAPPVEEKVTQTNTIIVKNLPTCVDEELLELFFESTKKQGGGPVKNVKILRDKNAAIVEFCEEESVEAVMKKSPLKFGTNEIEIQPYKPLLTGSEIISNVHVNLKGLTPAFTEELLKKHFDSLMRDPVPDYGPELFKLMEVGSRVVRGRDWKDIYTDHDGNGAGTVTKVHSDGAVDIKWDNGDEYTDYDMGICGKYTVKLA